MTSVGLAVVWHTSKSVRSDRVPAAKEVHLVLFGSIVIVVSLVATGFGVLGHHFLS
jgi:hypothetical protein